MTETNKNNNIALNCPLPKSDSPKILLSHGSGGLLSHKLIQDVFLSRFSNPELDLLHDGALLDISDIRIAFTTDSYVVDPLFFPGGDIGTLAVNGTINDLSVCGAKALYISAAFIIEEGFDTEELIKIADSMTHAADIAGVRIVTGDTKVVERGKGDKVFINTSGIGLIENDVLISPKRCAAGDVIIINGSIAEHGIAIMSKRQGFEFESEIQSDCAALNGLVQNILCATKNIHTMRDPTRGGLASVLNEIAEASGTEIILEETQIPVRQQVRAACEILGLDPLHIANEGKVLLFAPEEEAEKILNVMRAHPLGKDAALIGRVADKSRGEVFMRTEIGTLRKVDMLTGEQLPRIC